MCVFRYLSWALLSISNKVKREINWYSNVISFHNALSRQWFRGAVSIVFPFDDSRHVDLFSLEGPKGSKGNFEPREKLILPPTSSVGLNHRARSIHFIARWRCLEALSGHPLNLEDEFKTWRLKKVSPRTGKRMDFSISVLKRVPY